MITVETLVITVGGTLIMVLLSVVSFFLIRLVRQLDSLDGKLTKLEQQLALSAQTVDYLKEQLEKLQQAYNHLLDKYNALEKGVTAFDHWINNIKK